MIYVLYMLSHMNFIDLLLGINQSLICMMMVLLNIIHILDMAEINLIWKKCKKKLKLWYHLWFM